MNIGWTTRGMWPKGEPKPDQRVIFRGEFELASARHVTIRTYAPCPFRLWLDERLIGEGPSRFNSRNPEFEQRHIDLENGRHQIRIEAHYEGVETRLMSSLRPFVAVELALGEAPIDVSFVARIVTGFRPQVRRINPQLGWIDWQEHLDEAAEWSKPEQVPTLPNAPTRSFVTLPVHDPVGMRVIGDGSLTQRFGYANDDPPAGFYLRDLHPKAPAQGTWRRFDLGRVHLGRPEISLDVPRGAIVEIAQAESLTDGRVAPWLTLSTGASCNLDRFVARGGVETFTPTTPKGGRFVEVHVLAKPNAINWIRSAYRERAYFGEPEGTFRCSDPLLDRIWKVGVDTLRACAEDAIIDNPTRERGQWMGDALTVGLEIAGVAYHDLSLVRRGILQATQGARADGLVMGLGPGTPTYLPSYALHWIVACERYLRLTGDRALIESILGAIERNANVFLEHLSDDGIVGVPGWSFIDWGYEGGGWSDIGLGLFGYRALISLASLAETFSKDAKKYTKAIEQLRALIERRRRGRYHFEALSLQADLKGDADVVKRHMLKCFPNDPSAPRLADPSDAGPRLMTPFFSHFALDGLWRGGHGDFVLDQYRRCWGWALNEGLTTWPEVFDLRWSHCHQWSGCPTWQLSRYVLGLSPRFDVGGDLYEFHGKPCRLAWAEGRLPGKNGVRIRREGHVFTISSDEPIRIRSSDGRLSRSNRSHTIAI